MLCYPFSPIPDCCDQMTESRSQLDTTDDYYHHEGAYYYMEAADDQE